MEASPTVGSPTRRTRRIQSGTWNRNFWPSDKPCIADINKGRKPMTPAPPCKRSLGNQAALSEGLLLDRPTVKKIVDKISASGQQSYVRKVLRSYDISKTGFLSKDDLRSAMDRLALGLDDAEKNKVVARLDPENTNRIPVNKLVTSFEDEFEPLGLTSFSDRRFATLMRPPYNSLRRCMTPCGMSTKMAQSQGFDSMGTITYPQSLERRKEDKFRDLPTQQSNIPLATQMGIGEADMEAAIQAPETYALQQHLFFKGPGHAQRRLFSAHDASGRGCLPLEGLTRCCQAISPGIKPRDVAALVVAIDPTNTGQVDFRHFVSCLADSAPAHEKLLKTGRLGHETQHEKWGTSPITRQPPPITPGARFPTARSPNTTKGALFSSNLALSKSTFAGTRAGDYVSERPLGTGEDFRYGQPDVFDAQGEVDERKLVHAVSVVPLVQSLAAAHRSPQARSPNHRFAFLSTSMPEQGLRPPPHPSQPTSSDTSAGTTQTAPMVSGHSSGLGIASCPQSQPAAQQWSAEGCSASAGPTSGSHTVDGAHTPHAGAPQPSSPKGEVLHPPRSSPHTSIGGSSPPPHERTPPHAHARAHAPAQLGSWGAGAGQGAGGWATEADTGAAGPSVPMAAAGGSSQGNQGGVPSGWGSVAAGACVDTGEAGGLTGDRTAHELGGGSSSPSKVAHRGGRAAWVADGARGSSSSSSPVERGSEGRGQRGGVGSGRAAQGAGMGDTSGVFRAPAGAVTAADLYALSKGRDRFAHLNYPGTCHTTVPEPGSALFLEPSAQFVRKGDAAFMPWQAEDRDRKARQVQQKVKAAAESCNFVAERVARDEARVSQRDAANLEALGTAKERYAEHLKHIDTLRSMDARKISIHFGHGFGKSFLKEHLDSAAFFNRS